MKSKFKSKKAKGGKVASIPVICDKNEQPALN